MEFKDYVQDARGGTIRRAGRDLSRAFIAKLPRKYHPDVSKEKDDRRAHSRNWARTYEALKDPESARLMISCDRGPASLVITFQSRAACLQRASGVDSGFSPEDLAGSAIFFPSVLGVFSVHVMSGARSRRGRCVRQVVTLNARRTSI